MFNMGDTIKIDRGLPVDMDIRIFLTEALLR